MSELANQIAALSAVATPGEWVTAPDHISDQDYETCIELSGKAGQFGAFIADFHHNWAEDRISWKAAQSNAALIVALRNAVPQIIAALNAQAEVEALRKQLPKEMQDCTIVFEECEKGHGHLRGTNWIKHPCQQCEAEALRARVAIEECLNVSAYRAGMKAGWNFCDAGDQEGYQRAMEGTEHLAELRRIRKLPEDEQC